MTSTPTHVKWIWKRLEGIEKFTSWINKAIYTNDQRFFFFCSLLIYCPSVLQTRGKLAVSLMA